MTQFRVFVWFFVLISLILTVKCYNKYSKAANVENVEKKENQNPDFRPVSLKHLDRPFRMAKLNLLWSKAVLVSTATICKN